MNKIDRADWYAQASAEPVRRVAFTPAFRQQVLARIEQNGKSGVRRTSRKLAWSSMASIVVILGLVLWGNATGSLWFVQEPGIHDRYPASLSSWNEEMVQQFLHEVQMYVREIPPETDDLETIMERYEQYFSPELSREIVESSYIARDGKWMIPDGDAGYIFLVLNGSSEGEETAYTFGAEEIQITQTAPESMHETVVYVIRYTDRPIIAEWFLQGQLH